jgi:hypothetical protein
VERGICAKNTRVVSQLPTLWDADLRCAKTSMICQQKLWLCHEYVSPCLTLCHKYSISPSLFCLPNGIGKYAMLDLSRRYSHDFLVHRNLKPLASKSSGSAMNILTQVPNISWTVCMLIGIGEYEVLDLLQSYAQDSPVHWNFNHRPANAVAMLRISWHR